MEDSNRITGTDRLELLHTFVRIVEAGSLSAAAAQLGGTQPTVSRRLQSLEKALGVQLLQRSTHTLSPTADGERCYERAKELLAHWEAFDLDLRGSAAEVEGLLRVVAPHAFGQDLLVRIVERFLVNHPRVRVDWLLHDDRALHDYIAAGIDCAIHVGELQAPGVIALKLSEVPRIAVVAPDLLDGRRLPEHPAELAALPWLALSTYYRSEVELTHAVSGAVERVAFQPRFATDSLYALRTAALHGLGVSVGSAWLLDADIAAGRLVRLLPEWQAEALPVYLVYPHARFYPARLRHFIALMKEALPAAIAEAAERSA
ncbi:LysR family transcriptional regulator [Acidihalobacter ferrooxydans]|uniref:LysR family transcriptional regulator n=1 Tax=Acidihalobacter ferrooxydans TaxID=1765967 RepID=A0A1P8UEB6_9GAMM|nr:LysR family transcriptional regulator [Acidihalobacter ferrooxydans]APZ42156.1 LysR family transcriptional regulator [Acidihalobacter ferrooxydans]